jgi:hypothetical protein
LAAPETASAENWAVRGGWFYQPWNSGYLGLGGLGGLGDGLYVPPVPSAGVVAAVETRLATDTWLVVQLGGTYLESSAGDDGRGHNGRATVGAGVRQYLWSVEPVAFSLLGTLGGDYYDSLSSYGDRLRMTGFGISGQVGFAVDFLLTDQLALQLATPVVRARWSRVAVRSPDVERSDIEVRATLEPQLGLRVSF